jgi:hypothetical protein
MNEEYAFDFKKIDDPEKEGRIKNTDFKVGFRFHEDSRGSPQ